MVMKIKSEETLRSLINIFKINGYRMEVYKKLVNTIYHPELKRSFQNQVDESACIIEKLNTILDESLENSESPVLYEDARIDQSQFYFGMAKASKNIRTILVSCQFGDEFLMKTYQKMLTIFEIEALISLKETLGEHLSSLKKMSFDYDNYAL
jgi:ferritin-like metal-binding protein YciE